MFRMNKKGQNFDLLKLAAISFVVIAITIGMGAQIMSTLQTSQTVNSTAYNASAFGLTSLTTIGQWLPTIALVVAAVVVLGFVAFLRA
jgi:hypothetical protein